MLPNALNKGQSLILFHLSTYPLWFASGEKSRCMRMTDVYLYAKIVIKKNLTLLMRGDKYLFSDTFSRKRIVSKITKNN